MTIWGWLEENGFGPFIADVDDIGNEPLTRNPLIAESPVRVGGDDLLVDFGFLPANRFRRALVGNPSSLRLVYCS